MRLIIGGTASGKLSRIHELGYRDADILDCTKQGGFDKTDCKVLYKLNFLIDRSMKEGLSPKQAVATLIASSPLEVIVCDEVGCGVVPLNRYERDFRECVGRICCEIAASASIVERVYCGIAMVIKSDEN